MTTVAVGFPPHQELRLGEAVDVAVKELQCLIRSPTSMLQRLKRLSLLPLHWRRERWRWFNQSYEIAKTLAQQCNLSCQKALRRTRNTSQQALLDRGHRLANLQGAFQLSPRERRLETTRDKPVLLIDDVFTTGSTAEECARVLKEEGGAEKVVVLTVLRG